MIAKLNFLAKYLQKFNYNEYDEIIKLIKLSSILGVDYPAEEVDKEGIGEVLKYLDENPGKFIFLDNPEGSKKRFGQKNYREMPFHYGEFVEINNPSDDMGWDVVIVPSSSEVAKSEEIEDEDVAHVPSGHNLIPVGYVPVNDDQEEWTRKTKSKKKPQGKPAPVGNDKIILAPNGIVTDDDRKSIEEFFGSMWTFKDVIWL
jgi:hypothetical protein